MPIRHSPMLGILLRRCNNTPLGRPFVRAQNSIWSMESPCLPFCHRTPFTHLPFRIIQAGSGVQDFYLTGSTKRFKKYCRQQGLSDLKSCHLRQDLYLGIYRITQNLGKYFCPVGHWPFVFSSQKYFWNISGVDINSLYASLEFYLA